MLESIYPYLQKHLPVVTAVYKYVIGIHNVLLEILEEVRKMTATQEQVLAAIQQWQAVQTQLITDIQALLAVVPVPADQQALLDAVNAGITSAQAADATVQSHLTPPTTGA